MKRKLLYPIAVMASLALALTACGGSQAKESAKNEKGESKADAGSEAAKADASAQSGDGLVYWSMWEATEPQGRL